MTEQEEDEELLEQSKTTKNVTQFSESPPCMWNSTLSQICWIRLLSAVLLIMLCWSWSYRYKEWRNA